jgi:hypothetical protein
LIGNTAAKIINWADTAITCRVIKVPLPAGLNNVTIKVQPYKTAPAITLDSAFTVMGPMIDDVIPDFGSPGETITIRGRFFSTKKGKVYLEYEDKNGQTKKKNCRVKSWGMDTTTGQSTIIFEVPKGPEPSINPYSLFVTNKVGQASAFFTIDSR